MVIAVRQCNTKCIAQCSMTMAIPEASGCCHQATTHFVLPQRPPGQQQTKQSQKHTPTLLAILMAMAMRRYITACIAQWRRSRTSLEATGRRHCVSIMSNNIKGTHLHQFLLMVFIVNTYETGAKQKDGPN
jgi:hypothetical protein